MANLPGPYGLQFDLNGWTNPIRSHELEFNCLAVGNPSPGTAPSSITMQKAGGGTGTLDVVANQAWEFIRQFYSSAITCSGFTLWRYVTGTTGKDFVASGNVTNPAGLGGTIAIAAQVTLTFRAANGGLMKPSFVETIFTGDTRTTLVPNPAGNAIQKFAAYVLSVDGIFMARDDSFPIQALRDSRGQNEKIWRDIYRST